MGPEPRDFRLYWRLCEVTNKSPAPLPFLSDCSHEKGRLCEGKAQDMLSVVRDLHSFRPVAAGEPVGGVVRDPSLDRRQVEFSRFVIMVGWLRHQDSATSPGLYARLPHAGVLRCSTYANPPRSDQTRNHPLRGSLLCAILHPGRAEGGRSAPHARRVKKWQPMEGGGYRTWPPNPAPRSRLPRATVRATILREIRIHIGALHVGNVRLGFSSLCAAGNLF